MYTARQPQIGERQGHWRAPLFRSADPSGPPPPPGGVKTEECMAIGPVWADLLFHFGFAPPSPLPYQLGARSAARVSRTSAPPTWSPP